MYDVIPPTCIPAVYSKEAIDLSREDLRALLKIVRIPG
jgi:alpha-mannosidase